MQHSKRDSNGGVAESRLEGGLGSLLSRPPRPRGGVPRSGISARIELAWKIDLNSLAASGSVFKTSKICLVQQCPTFSGASEKLLKTTPANSAELPCPNAGAHSLDGQPVAPSTNSSFSEVLIVPFQCRRVVFRWAASSLSCKIRVFRRLLRMSTDETNIYYRKIVLQGRFAAEKPKLPV